MGRPSRRLPYSKLLMLALMSQFALPDPPCAGLRTWCENKLAEFANRRDDLVRFRPDPLAPLADHFDWAQEAAKLRAEVVMLYELVSAFNILETENLDK